MSAYPITYEQAPPVQRSRLTVFFRALLVIPHVIWFMLYGLAAYVAVIIAWCAILVTGHYPAPLYGFVSGFVRFSTRFTAYAFLVVDEFAPFDGGEHPEYPVRLNLGPPQETYGRITALFRLILAIPLFFLQYGLELWLLAVAVAIWFVALITGRTSPGLMEATRFPVSFYARTNAYIFLLTDRYPPLLGRGQALAFGLTIVVLGGAAVAGTVGGSSEEGGILDSPELGAAGDELDEELQSAERRTQARPADPVAWAELTRLRIRRANLDDPTSEKAQQAFELASESWERYLALDPEDPDEAVASAMVRVYQGPLNAPAKAAGAMQIVTAEAKPPNSRLYAQLAALAYAAGDARLGDLASNRAIALARADERSSLRQALRAMKQSAAAGAPSAPGG